MMGIDKGILAGVIAAMLLGFNTTTYTADREVPGATRYLTYEPEETVEEPTEAEEVKVDTSVVDVTTMLPWAPLYEDGTRNGKPFILDLDFASDVDDACAIRMASTMHKMGYIDLKAISLCVNGVGNLNVYAANGLLNSSGLGYIPIGISSVNTPGGGKYWSHLADWAADTVYMEDSVRLWRRIISSSDKPVDILTVGFVSNLAAFCQGGPDDISDKTGLELVNSKVGNIYIGGGAYPSGLDFNFWGSQGSKDGMDWLLRNLTRPLIFISNDVGAPVVCGTELLKDPYSTDPLARALRDYGQETGRIAWDPMATWVACTTNKLEDCLQNGLALSRVNFYFNHENGGNTFEDSETGRFWRLYRINTDIGYYNNLMDSYMER